MLMMMLVMMMIVIVIVIVMMMLVVVLMLRRAVVGHESIEARLRATLVGVVLHVTHKTNFIIYIYNIHSNHYNYTKRSTYTNNRYIINPLPPPTTTTTIYLCECGCESRKRVGRLPLGSGALQSREIGDNRSKQSTVCNLAE